MEALGEVCRALRVHTSGQRNVGLITLGAEWMVLSFLQLFQKPPRDTDWRKYLILSLEKGTGRPKLVVAGVGWGGVNSDMIVLVHLEEVLTRVLRQGTSGFCLWEPLSVQSRHQAWLWKRFLVQELQLAAPPLA